MKTAIVCITKHGYHLGLRVKQRLLHGNGEVDLFAPARAFVDPGEATLFQNLADTVQSIFPRYRQIVFIMALGIVVRIIAKHIQDKTTDPAVVVIDEAGLNVISVLSGHLGGANSLAKFIAASIGARAVITTATDVHGLPAVDDLARELNLAIDPVSAVRKVNSAVVNGETVHIYTRIPLPVKPSSNVKIYQPEDYLKLQNHARYHVIITNRLMGNLPDNTMFLRPRNLVAGVGCRSGTSENDILKAVQNALARCGYSILSLRALATIGRKAGEPGLIGAAAALNLPILSFSAEEINNFFQTTRLQLHSSEFVRNSVGVPAVCEPAALLATGKGELILPKQQYPGITVAIAEDR